VLGAKVAANGVEKKTPSLKGGKMWLRQGKSSFTGDPKEPSRTASGGTGRGDFGQAGKKSGKKTFLRGFPTGRGKVPFGRGGNVTTCPWGRKRRLRGNVRRGEGSRCGGSGKGLVVGGGGKQK